MKKRPSLRRNAKLGGEVKKYRHLQRGAQSLGKILPNVDTSIQSQVSDHISHDGNLNESAMANAHDSHGDGTIQVQSRLSQFDKYKDLAESDHLWATNSGALTKDPISFTRMEFDPQIAYYKGHKKAVTSVTLPSQNPTIAYTGSKDCCVIRWDLNSGTKTKFFGRRNEYKERGGHFADCLDVVASPCGNFFFSCGRDQSIRIWDTRISTTECVLSLLEHQGAVVNICIENLASFSLERCTLFSLGMDRALREWDLSRQRSVETFYGHTASPTCMDIFKSRQPITGSEDCTLRAWKIDSRTHLLYEGQNHPIEAVAHLNNNSMVSSSQNGTLALWTPRRRKPLQIVSLPYENDDTATALTSAEHSNLFLVGTARGNIAGWRTGAEKAPSLQPIPNCSLNANGMITQLASASNVAVAAISSEPRLGRWTCHKKAINGICVFRYALT